MVGKVRGPIVVTQSGICRRVQRNTPTNLSRIGVSGDSVYAEAGWWGRWVPVHRWEEHIIGIGQRPAADLVEWDGEVLWSPPSEEGGALVLEVVLGADSRVVVDQDVDLGAYAVRCACGAEYLDEERGDTWIRAGISRARLG